jgi:hypothetical protein
MGQFSLGRIARCSNVQAGWLVPGSETYVLRDNWPEYWPHIKRHFVNKGPLL